MERYTTLLEGKGDNFEENTGGVRENDGVEGTRRLFDTKVVTESLRKLVFPMKEAIVAEAESVYLQDEEKRMVDDFLEIVFERMKAAVHESSHKRSSSPKPR